MEVKKPYRSSTILLVAPPGSGMVGIFLECSIQIRKEIRCVFLGLIEHAFMFMFTIYKEFFYSVVKLKKLTKTLRTNADESLFHITEK